MRELGDPGVYEREFASYGEALAAEVATLTCTAEEAAAWAVERVRLRPGFHELVERSAPLIVSSGLEQLILPVLAREGVVVELLANSAEPRPDGWRIRFRDPGPCPVCGDVCKRAALPDGTAVYVGDGVSDRCAALAAERVFARGELADYLQEQEVPFEPFDELHDVLRAVDVRRMRR